MTLTDRQLEFYDHQVLRLPTADRTTYTEQVDRLIEKLTEKIHADTTFRVDRVRKAGSFAKHTILRRMGGVAPDVDVAFFLKDRDASTEDYASLSDTIHSFLVKSYPNKSVEDFTIGRRTATVQFIRSGLTVDVVPIIASADKSGYGWQYFEDGERVETYPRGQIDFINARKKAHDRYRALVRMSKQWRNYCEVPGLKSYAIELLLAHLFDQDPASRSMTERFRRFLLYLVQSELKEVVSFPENTRPLGQFTDPVVIIDSVNSANNVASRITEPERLAIIAAAEEAYARAQEADAEDDLPVWKEIFGPRFQVEAT